MATPTGSMHFRVTFRRRPVTGDGSARGDFADWFSTRGGFMPLSAAQTALAGQTQDVILGLLTVRDRAELNELTTAERVVINGSEFGIDSVPIKDLSGFRDIRVRRTLGD